MGRGTELMKTYLDILNAREMDRLGEVLSDHYEINVPGLEDGFAGARRAVEGLCAMIPDIQGTMTHSIEEGDLVCGFFKWTGTHTRPILGLEPTGAALEWMTADLWRFDEKLFLHWDVVDFQAIVEQARAKAGLPRLLKRPNF